MDAERATVDAIARILRRAAPERADIVVRETLRALPHLDGKARALVARRIYAVCVLRARLAHQAESSIDDADALLAAYLRHHEEGAPLPRPWPADPVERVATERSAPPFLVEELARSLTLAGADAFLAASNEPGPTTLRVNVARLERSALAARLEQEGVRTRAHRLVTTALDVVGHANLFGSTSWREGLFEVQDASSQLAALACEPKPGDVVVDLCAGRGGKSLALAALTGDVGRLFVHDVDERALGDLWPRTARAGLRSLVAGLPLEGTADVVLVDAPCSSLGPLRRSPDLRWRLTPADLEPLPALQQQLVQQGARLLRPGGRLVYATCTVRREENDDVVAAAAQSNGLALVTSRLLLPHVEGTDGFYFAVFRSR